MIEATGTPLRPAPETVPDSLLVAAESATDSRPRLQEEDHPWRVGFPVFALAACLVPLAYALYTDHTWEDFFITFRFSQNLIEGEGLVYNPGERVHGFTSPLGVLLPALCYLVTGMSSYVPALWLFRLISIAAFTGGGVLLWRCLRGAAPDRPLSVWLFGFLYVLEAKAVAFTVNGMETGFMLFFLAWGVLLAVRGGVAQWPARGVCWAGLMWTRPDGCVYVAALTAAEVLFGPASRKGLLASLAKSAAVCTALYLPWFLGTWAYYGSPIPHTVVAKSFVERGAQGQLHWLLTDFCEHYTQAVAMVFRPVYAIDLGGWRDNAGLMHFVGWLTKAAALFCAGYWLLPVRDRLGRLASFCFALVSVYLASLMAIFPWYLPPVTLLGLIVVSRGVLTLAEAVQAALPQDAVYGCSKALAYTALAAFGLWHVALFGLTTWQMRVQQREVEMGNRAPLGHWLRAHARPGDRVYLEAVGYIGYFSGLKVLDYPGLVSPEVVRLRKERRLDMAGVVPELRPEWVVLRPWELDDFKAAPSWPEFQERYSQAALFDVANAVEQYKFLPGRGYLWIDVTFTVFRRRDAAGNGPADARD